MANPKNAASKASMAAANALSTALVPAAATVQPTLRIAIDYGTVNLAASIQHAFPGVKAELQDIFPVSFTHDLFEVPTTAGFNGAGFLYGAELEQMVKTGKLPAEKAIRHQKLALYKDHKSHEITQRVQQQLAADNQAMETLIAHHLNAIVTEILDFADRTPTGATFRHRYLEKEWYLSIPQMWDPNATKVMIKAARYAGLQNVELVYEPQAAAAFTLDGLNTYIKRFTAGLPYALVPGDVVQVADLGGGTGDFVSYAIDKVEAGAEVELRLVGKPSGALCGSEFVNRNFVRWLRNECKEIQGHRTGFVSLLKRLGVTEFGFDFAASSAFEVAKKQYPFPEKSTIAIAGTGRADKKVEINADLIRGFHDPVIDEVIEMIKAQLLDETRMIVVPGGFGYSKYLHLRLREVFDPEDESYEGRRVKIFDSLRNSSQPYHPVTTGTLLRYEGITARGIPAKYTFGITQVEEWDPDVHLDATWYAGEVMDDDGTVAMEATPNWDIVEGDPIHQDMHVVGDRWVTLVEKGTLTKPDETYGANIYQVQYLYEGERRLTTSIYWTERDMEDHEAINVDGHRRDDIYEWDKVTMEIGPDRLGYVLKDVPGTDRQAYEIWWSLRLELRGALVGVRWQLLKEGEQPFDAEGDMTGQRTTSAQVEKEKLISILSTDANPFPRDSAE